MRQKITLINKFHNEIFDAFLETPRIIDRFGIEHTEDHADRVVDNLIKSLLDVANEDYADDDHKLREHARLMVCESYEAFTNAKLALDKS